MGGDCDNDDDCAGYLKCFQRSGFTPVTGCHGTGASDWDYCYDTKEPHLKNVGEDPDMSVQRLDVCAGDCDNDTECKTGLKCFQRSGFTDCLVVSARAMKIGTIAQNRYPRC